MKHNVCHIILVCISAVNCNPTKPLKIKNNFVYINPGTYQLGEKGHPINPLHNAKTNGYWICQYEVTNQEFREFVQKTNYKTVAELFKNAQVYEENLPEFQWVQDTTANWLFPDGQKYGGIEKKMQYPVTCICFYDMLAYCKWKKVRLPTLDEWEIAARAGSNSKYFFGNEYEKIAPYANIWYTKNHLKPDTSDGFAFTSPVGKFNPNPWQLYDIYGNVFEMCSNVPEYYSKMKDIGSARGGSWWCGKYSCNFVNNVSIGKISKSASFSNMGFRVVKDSM